MIALWIILAVVAFLILVILLGGIQLRIICRESLTVRVGVLGIHYTLISDKKKRKKKQKTLTDCRDPDAALRREEKRRKKAQLKAEKKRKKAEKKARKKAKKQSKQKTAKAPSPNLRENLAMIRALLKKLYETTHGRVKLRVRSMHIRVGCEDAAATAILYGVILQSASYILSFIEAKFTHVSRKEGAISISPDYISGHTTADIDIAVSIKFRHAIRLGVTMLLAYAKESRAARKKALLRTMKKMEK